MRQFISILLLFIFLFNVGGYYLLFLGLQVQADKRLESQIDENIYTQEGEISITIPLNIPYPVYSSDFARTEGNFELSGEYYRVIKQKVSEGSTTLVCVKNHQQKILTEAMSEFSKMINDLSKSGKRSRTVTAKFLKDFAASGQSKSVNFTFWTRDLTYGEIQVFFEIPFRLINGPPPRS